MSSVVKVRAEEIKQQIGDLLRNNPELEEDDALRVDMIEGETSAIDFLRAMERKRIEAQAVMDALTAVMKGMQSRISRFERREHAFRTLMKQILDASNLKKLELPEATLVVRNGSPKVIVTDEDELPDSFIRIKREPNKVAIGATLKAGGDVPGATLSNAEPYLAIMIK